MSSKPTAKIASNRLVLNLPDAETPALWVMDLDDAQTSVIRLEADKGGLYVLKKHGGKGAETIAVYSSRDAGTNAMNVAAKALEKSRGASANGNSDGGQGRAGRIFTYFVMVWFMMWSIGMMPFIMHFILSPFAPSAQTASAAPEAAAAKPAAPARATAEQAGIPMSADDFLKNQMK